MRRTLFSSGCGVVSLDVGFNPILTAGPQSTQTLRNGHGMCDINAANLFCCEILYCSRFEALRILSIRKNNLPDVVISPVN